MHFHPCDVDLKLHLFFILGLICFVSNSAYAVPVPGENGSIVPVSNPAHLFAPVQVDFTRDSEISNPPPELASAFNIFPDGAEKHMDAHIVPNFDMVAQASARRLLNIAAEHFRLPGMYVTKFRGFADWKDKKIPFKVTFPKGSLQVEMSLMGRDGTLTGSGISLKIERGRLIPAE
ncbi:uncharacterized protein C8R40DRAFT_1178425 [Lentinula edodes]|uniref:uncharacterized protein n=1 Tax=Lentinula edodes TaxID=5353 RepID=UPI001E8D4EEB|nr:uncharacterized protein C8R40DRAFT_1178425 [Lentinula edodes]KAH7867940.1 hypothetical protein C8R40DRAFT_1178425 [Lentinula edodes]